MSDDPFKAVFGDIFTGEPKKYSAHETVINDLVSQVVCEYSRARAKANEYGENDRQKMCAHWEGRCAAYARAVEILKGAR